MVFYESIARVKGDVSVNCLLFAMGLLIKVNKLNCVDVSAVGGLAHFRIKPHVLV